jgi:uncharacterized protein (TIGR00369 family)
MDRDQLLEFLAGQFPQATAMGFAVEEVGEGTVRLRQPVDERHLRPGGTISGPTLMTLADTAMYLALLAAIGPVALAVTTNLNINFLRKPGLRDLVADAELLKLGKRLAVGAVTIYSDGVEGPVAHATLTYSIPAEHHNQSGSSRA